MPELPEEAVKVPAADSAPVKQERPRSWLQPQLLVPLGTFVIGVLTPASPVFVELIRQGVEQKVYEATFAEKKRVLETQSAALGLQEDYIGKLREIRDVEDRLSKALAAAERARVETQSLQEQLQNQNAEVALQVADAKRAADIWKQKALADDRARAEYEEQNKKSNARIAPFLGHVCSFEHVPKTETRHDGMLRISGGQKVVFAAGTKDQKVFSNGVVQECATRSATTSSSAPPSSSRLVEFETRRASYEMTDQKLDCEIKFLQQSPRAREKAGAECDKHAQAFLTANGLTANEISMLKRSGIVARLKESGPAYD